MRLHPSAATLSRYQDGELDLRRRSRVAAHLADCHSCRTRLREWRDAAVAIREGPIPPMSADLFDRIERRRAEGERMILPLAQPEAPRRKYRLAPAVAVALALLVIGSAVFFAAPDLRADASELLFFPATPAAGEQVRVEYQASSLLSGEDRLVLRARLRVPRDGAYNQGKKHVTVAELTRSGDGVFRGSFRLPDSIVYAIFAVEDVEAGRVDSNGRRGWDLLVHDGDGRPLYEALEQKTNDLMGRNWEAAFETARATAALYPERPGSWSQLQFFEAAVLGDEAMDSLREAHRTRLRELHQALTGRAVSGDDAGSMFFYSWGLGDSITQEHWRDRLAREHPSNQFAVQNRIVFELAREYRDQPAVLLAELERMWEEIGPVHIHQGDQGLGAARRTGDPEAILRWADRYLHFRPAERPWVASLLTELPALRDEGLARLRDEIGRVAASRSEDRDLFATADDQRRRSQRELRLLYGTLGTALIGAGEVRVGLDTLALAVANGWDTGLFREVAEARLAAGDRAGAIELWARVAVDPATGDAFADTVRTRAGEDFDEQRWESLTTRARDVMRSEVLADATPRPIRGRVRLLDAIGKTYSLDELRGGDPTLVVFWSRRCGPALEALPEIDRVANRLRAHGARVLMIVDEPPSVELQALLEERGVNLPLYHDTRRDAVRAFEQWGTPQYFVLDDVGRIHFEYSSLDAVERQISVLAAAK
jgi:peroxiredoxin